MPSFITVADALQGNDALKNVNYIDINESQREFIRKDTWEVKWIQPPRAVYFPGQAMMNARCTSYSSSISTSLSGISETIRGYKLNQKTTRDTSGSLTLEFVDKEDQAISIFAEDWANKISDAETKYSFRKEDTVAKIHIPIFNTSRIVIRELQFYACQPSDTGIKEEGSSEVEQSDHLGKVSMSLDFEHYKRIFRNI